MTDLDYVYDAAKRAADKAIAHQMYGALALATLAQELSYVVNERNARRDAPEA